MQTRILPDGCIDVIWIADRPPFVAGPMTAPVIHAAAPGTAIAGVRFRPGVAPFLLGVSARDLLNRDVALRDLWPAHRHRSWDDAIPREARAAAPGAIAAAVSHAIADLEEREPFVPRAARWLANNPSATVGDLVRLSGLSERQVRRRFDEAVGYGPKTLQRILRLQRLLWMASQERAEPYGLGRLSFAAGYADQPHMTREVAALAGAPPGLLLREARPRSAVADLFKTVVGRSATVGT